MTEDSSLELLLSRALEFEQAEERSGFLDLACAGDGELRREVESLVEAHLAADTFLRPRLVPDRGPPAENPGDRIGRYKLREMIGEGGFGRVWMAEQQEPVRRMVALKIVKLGMDTREVLARFKVERQALALMDHPHIARVYDGGATDSGRPYFVMELVKGTPITNYCEVHQLGVRQRLELFLDVVAAVQHAHQKGVIHRDLKPSNILVSTQDGRPVVKVIDFGIAKAVSMELTGTTVMTAYGRMIGTPEYMSPEQAELNVLDVDTRSDIYSLGVVLYELLTGATPLDPALLRKAGFTEMQRMIREDKALKPSSRITQLRQQGAASPPQPASARPDKPSIGREMDWVVMQALEKDRSRRYQTANGLGMDIRRFLDDEPVSASPPSATYRVAKFAKRHRAAAAWTIVFMIVVLVAAIGMTALYFDKKREASATERERTKAVEAERVAERQTWESLLSQVAALRWSGEPERRFQALKALREAAAMEREANEPGNEVRLRDSTIACLAIVDMQALHEWSPYPDQAEMMAADPALTRYASTAADGRILLHGYPDHRIQRELPGAGFPVAGVLRFSPDGSRLVAGYQSDAGLLLKSWRVEGAAAPVDLGQGSHKAFAFFPDGARCVIGRPDGSLSVLEVSTGRELHRFSFPDAAHSLAVNRQGRWIAASFGRSDSRPARVEVLDAESGTIQLTLPCPAQPVAWSPTDDSLAAGCMDGFVRLWNAEDWSTPMLLANHSRTVDAVAWSPDGRLLASQSEDGDLRLWDPFQGTSLSRHAGRSSDLAFSADGTRLSIVRERDKIMVMEVEAGDVCYRGRGHTGDAGVFDGAWSPSKTLLATTGDDGVRLWNREGRQLGFLKVPGSRGVAFAADSLFVASPAGLHRWPVAEAGGEDGPVVTLGSPVAVGSFRACQQLSPYQNKDQKVSLLAMAGESRDGPPGAAIWLFDLTAATPPRRLEAPAKVATCAISPLDGRWLAAGTSEGDGVRVWDLANLSVVADLPIRGSARVAFSPHFPRLLTGDAESYRLWETGSWTMKNEFLSQMTRSSGLMAFSPRPTALIVACRRAELKVLNPFTLDVLSSPDFDRESPLCFDPTGRIMITVGQTGGVFFWKLDALRARLKEMPLKVANLKEATLDWEEMEAFEDPVPPVLKRVIAPEVTF